MDISYFLKSVFPFDSWLGAIPILFFAFITFLVLREVVLWYWKIGKIVELLEKIEKNTRAKHEDQNVDVKLNS